MDGKEGYNDIYLVSIFLKIRLGRTQGILQQDSLVCR